MAHLINEFHSKHIQGLYNYYHYERKDGAWFQRSMDFKRKEIVYCPSEGAKFLRFPDIEAFKAHLDDENWLKALQDSNSEGPE